jgi:hypothetical protein
VGQFQTGHFKRFSMYPGKNGMSWWEYKGLQDRKKREEAQKERLKKANQPKDALPEPAHPEEPPKDA